MLELFFKHLTFIGVVHDNPKHEPHEKYLVKFEDENLNRHWLAFYTIYSKGRKSAFDDIGVWAIQNVAKINL